MKRAAEEKLKGGKAEMLKYKTIVIDPPWPGPGSTPAFDRMKADREILIPYVSMTGVQLASLKIDAIAADDAQIFIWATSRSLGDAFLLLGAWRFNFRALIVWRKPLGLGRHVMHRYEFVLWGSKMGAKIVPPGKAIPQEQTWSVYENGKRLAHSEKPHEAYELFEKLGDGPRIDIFARKPRDGWDVWGNEAGKEPLGGGK